MEIRGIKVQCETCDELNETFLAANVIKELEELQLEDVEWLDYLLDFMFADIEGWNDELQSIVENDYVKKVTFKIGKHMVTLTKF